MKRDLDLIRLVLLKLEEFSIPPGAADAIGGQDLKIAGYDTDQIGEHLAMLVDGRFVAARGGPGMDGRFLITGLSWEGHEFLNAIRSQAIWDKAKGHAAKVGAWTVGVLWEFAKEAVKQEVRKVIGSAS